MSRRRCGSPSGPPSRHCRRLNGNFRRILGSSDPGAALHAAIEEGGDPLVLLRRCANALVPAWADLCELDLEGDDHVVRIVAGLDPVTAAKRERSQAPLTTPGHPIADILHGGPARLLDLAVREDEPLFGPADDPTSARGLGLTTAVLAPIRAGGGIIGTLALGRGKGEPFQASDVDVAADLARRIGLAWHNSILLAEKASILASLNDGLIVTDADGVVTEVNERWCEISGFDEATCLGARMPYPWSPTGPDVEGDDLAAAAAIALRDGRVETRIPLQRADGTRFPGLVSVGPMIDRSTGERRGLVASVKDLSVREAAQTDLAALQRVTARLAAARDVAEVVDATLAEVLRRPAVDAAFLTRLGPDGQHIELVGAAGPLAQPIADRGGFPVDRLVPANVAVRDGTSVIVRSADELSTLFPDMLPESADLGISSVVAAPVRRQGEPVGALALWSTRPAAFSSRDAQFIEAVAGQYGQARLRAEGYEVEHRASQALQGRLLFDVPVLHERATIATRYQPASTEVDIGGDWYDVVPLGPERLAVVVGDVVGSGVDAAAVMGQLRSGLKGVALVSPEPVAVLEALDRLAAIIGGAPGATVCYALIDLAHEEVRFARAGHPPPVHIHRSGTLGATFLEGWADPPLGLGLGGHRREAVVTFQSGDVLLLYTDGLVERRKVPLVDRLELLRSSAAEARGGSVEALVDRVVAACASDGQQRDDLAVIAVRDEPAGPERFRALVPARPRELSPLRHRFRRWLLDVGLDDTGADDVILATSEAVTNAVEHAYRDVLGSKEMVGVVATADEGGVSVEVRDTGRWKARPSQTTRGRGLAIARALLGDVELRTGPSGTTVAFRCGRRTRGR